MFGFNANRGAMIAGLLIGSLVFAGCNDETGASVAHSSASVSPATSASPGAPANNVTAITTTTTSASAPANSPASTPQTLALAGSAAASVKVGEAFSFTPTLAGATGAVGFTIQNKPVWAAFNVATGALTGTPSAANVGTYANIVISAADAAGREAALGAFALAVVQVGASTGAATLSWTPPTQNTDGSPIANLAGYRIYYGASANAMTKSINVTNPGLTAYTVADLASGTQYFGITAYTTDGIESAMSSIGSKVIM